MFGTKFEVSKFGIITPLSLSASTSVPSGFCSMMLVNVMDRMVPYLSVSIPAQWFCLDWLLIPGVYLLYGLDNTPAFYTPSGRQ